MTNTKTVESVVANFRGTRIVPSVKADRVRVEVVGDLDTLKAVRTALRAVSCLMTKAHHTKWERVQSEWSNISWFDRHTYVFAVGV